MSHSETIKSYQSQVDKALDHWLPADSIPPKHLHSAMRYSVLSNGKRIRPILTYATGHALGITLTSLDGPAAAVELIHAYSLIHDDLPAMDDDDLRRGRPTCHKAFDEATAILAGDALQALAFYILSHDQKITTIAENRLKMIETLASASGSRGMAGGQAIDLASVGEKLSLPQLENMHIHKTGALIRAAVKMGTLSSLEATNNQIDKLDHYAKCIGLAFQVWDDVLDIEGDTEVIGKPKGSDIEQDKPTYPNLLGMAGAKQTALDLHDQAMDSLRGFDQKADTLRWIADYIVSRNK
ncbi:MAG: (2E,6E)-farnesyl diphosphate synthase [Gammaproteobacteria bacterium]